MAEEPNNSSQITRKRNNLARLRDQFNEQESLLRATWGRSQGWEGASDSQMGVIRELFDEAATALPEKKIRFTDNNGFEGLLAQISAARSKVNDALTDIESSLGIQASPPSPISAPTSSKQSSPDPRRVFVVHGRDEKVRQAMFGFLRAIGLDPIEWEELISMTGQGAPYTGHAIDVAFSQAHAAIILLTGDDLACLKPEFISAHDDDSERKPTPQARPNVLLELGLAFGRKPDRTIIVEFGKTRPISDAIGRNVIRFSDTPGFRQKLTSRLRNAGCAVNTNSRSDWLSATFDFPSIPGGSTNDVRFQKELTEQPKRAPSTPRLEALSATPSVEEHPELESRFIVSPPLPDPLTHLPAKWPEGLTAHLELLNGTILGITVYVGNDTDSDIASFVLQVTEAAYWSQTHQKFLPQRFATKPILSANSLRAMHRTDNARWIVRVFREGKEHCLAVGDDSNSLLKPPNYEPHSSVERWRLTLQMSYDHLLNLEKKNATALKPFHFFVSWDKTNRLISMSEG